MVYIGSARADEHGKYAGGAPGDQKQTSAQDYAGEVSMQKIYKHSKGWDIFRARNPQHARNLAEAMIVACNNKNIGYSQSDRLGVITRTVDSLVKTNCDCSSLVRACIIRATGKDVGNFTTKTEKSALLRSGIFDYEGVYKNEESVETGDILVTRTQGHTVIVVHCDDVKQEYYPRYTGKSTSIVDALKEVGESDVSPSHRMKIAQKNKISNYVGRPEQNTLMLTYLKSGVLRKP